MALLSRPFMRLLAVGFALLGAARLAAAETAAPDGIRPLAGETVFIPALRGIICVPDEAAAQALPPPAFAGVDISRTPVLADGGLDEFLRHYLGQPVSFGSLDRLGIGLRIALRAMGRPFVTIHSPPQDVTDGVLRLVVRSARLDGELRVEGAKWFSEESYRAAVPAAAGAEIDAVAIQAGVERLNRNPYRRVAIAVEPGGTEGTARLTLRTQESRPWQLSFGYNNNGTAVTDEDRWSTGVTWGNAFGRGATLGYSFTADPELKHSLSHSLHYGETFEGGHSLGVFGAHSSVESLLPVPLTQEGKSWQLGARFGIPLRKSAGGWERRVEVGVDFKYSDNTLEFAAIPITDNVTHIAQAGVTLSLSRATAADHAGFSVGLFGSPGGLTDENDDAAFDVSRPGARASYVYGRVEATYGRLLPQGFSLSLRGTLQVAGSPLLGVEQLAGSGSGAVRGYRESVAFGDDGVLGSVELHAPAQSWTTLRGRADFFVFLDAARLHSRGPQADNTSLASAGPGLNLAVGRHFSLRTAYGWRLEKLPGSAENGHGHISAGFQF